MAYEDAMREAVESVGGKIDAEEYLLKVQEILRSQGGDPAIESLKTNAFNNKRMTEAGVARVQIGKRKMVWLEEPPKDVAANLICFEQVLQNFQWLIYIISYLKLLG